VIKLIFIGILPPNLVYRLCSSDSHHYLYPGGDGKKWIFPQYSPLTLIDCASFSDFLSLFGRAALRPENFLKLSMGMIKKSFMLESRKKSDSMVLTCFNSVPTPTSARAWICRENYHLSAKNTFPLFPHFHLFSTFLWSKGAIKYFRVYLSALSNLRLFAFQVNSTRKRHRDLILALRFHLRTSPSFSSRYYLQDSNTLIYCRIFFRGGNINWHIFL
jgi:hypothetical protein